MSSLTQEQKSALILLARRNSKNPDTEVWWKPGWESFHCLICGAHLIKTIGGPEITNHGIFHLKENNLLCF